MGNNLNNFYRRKTTDDIDFYPTPPWATRALFKYVIGDIWKNYNCLEPACGKGHMSDVLKGHFKEVYSYDLIDYGYGKVADFLDEKYCYDVDWVITNPPFNQVEKFILRALENAATGVAMFGRIQLMEGRSRYENIFSKQPPTIIAPFVERVSTVKNKVVKKSGSTNAFVWYVWENWNRDTKVKWIPPCQKELEKEEDYIEKENEQLSQ